jgi:Chaperone for flagella basal body P-ring formation
MLIPNSIVALSILAVLGAGAAATQAAAPSLIVLPEYAVTHSSAVRVSDLLPEGSSAALRDWANGVVLGDAPAPGSTRDFRRAQIEAVLRQSPEGLNLLQIPAVVHVSRWARILSGDEVRIAVERSLRGSQLPDSDALAGAKVDFTSPVLLADEKSSPEVTSVDLSASPDVVRARLWIPAEPRVTPFWVVLRLRPDIGAASLTSPAIPPALLLPMAGRLRTTANTRPSRSQVSDVAPLVRSGKTVSLALCSPGMRITTLAAAMQSGQQGEQVRVRVLPSGRQVIAKVVGPSSVEADY